MDQDKFEDYIRTRLQVLGWGQKDLANRSGILESTLSHLLNGTTKLTAKTADKLASLPQIGASADELLRMAGQIRDTGGIFGKPLAIAKLSEILSPEGQQRLLDYATFLQNQEDRARASASSADEDRSDTNKQHKQRPKRA